MTSQLVTSSVEWMLQDSELIITDAERWWWLIFPPERSDKDAEEGFPAKARESSTSLFTAQAEIICAEERPSS